MAAIVTEIPYSFKRRNAEAIDKDSTFTTTSARMSYLTNPLRYAGQIVYDSETDSAYKLNVSRDAWVKLKDGITPKYDFTNNGTINIPAHTLVTSFILISDIDVSNVSIGTAPGTPDIVPPVNLVAGQYTVVNVQVVSSALLPIYIEGLNTNNAAVTLYIYSEKLF